jgi:allantoinase
MMRERENAASRAMRELLFRGQRVVLDSAERAASVRVREGRIVSVEEIDASPNGAEVVDVGEAMLLPGLVDTHVHVNEPGRTEGSPRCSTCR